MAGLCDLQDRQVLVADNTNSTVVIAIYGNNTNEVQFNTIIKSELVPGSKIWLHHTCLGIAHHEGDFFLDYGTALYKFSLSGKSSAECMMMQQIHLQVRIVAHSTWYY
ncbi:hypothetical protein DPMN_191461 [Dreissena polymorpha]|uniref:Uncharacterized protein n=1 Tax=Dreissena polymorpha TaxID=45954 RepID=A0A9D4BC38_DREPO|nr:hypothetical protein DPMN_191461 [Dreissena polymorpha]